MTSDDIDEKESGRHRSTRRANDEGEEFAPEEDAMSAIAVEDTSNAAVEDDENSSEDSIGEDDEGVSFTHQGQSEYEEENLDSPPFDLDEEGPLDSGTKGNALPSRTNVKSAKEFFNGEIHYRYDILEDEVRAEVLGSYRIELKGFQGGIWTITVADQVDVVNRREDAEIVLTMQQRDFLQLVNGQLNPQLAVFAQKMRVTGDLRKAVAFQAILSPGAD